MRPLPGPWGVGPAEGRLGVWSHARQAPPPRRLVTVATLLAILAALVPGAVADAQPTRTLRLFPSPVVVAPGESVAVTAWFCRVPEAGDVFGPDGIPGTDDDGCQRVKAEWSVEDQAIARVKPRTGTRTQVTGRRDGLTSLSAAYQATATSSFVSRIGVDVAEPLPAPEAVDADDGVEASTTAVPGAPVVQPGFAILAPGDSQLFSAYLCPLITEGDPRGADANAGTLDDYCKLIEATWSILGEPPAGTIDPIEGFFTVFTADGEEPDRTAFVAHDGAGPQTAADEGRTTPGSDPQSGAVLATIGTLQASGSIGIDRGAQPIGRIPGDANGDGVITRDDGNYIEDLLDAGDYDENADLNRNGVMDEDDLFEFELLYDD